MRNDNELKSELAYDLIEVIKSYGFYDFISSFLTFDTHHKFYFLIAIMNNKQKIKFKINSKNELFLALHDYTYFKIIPENNPMFVGHVGKLSKIKKNYHMVLIEIFIEISKYLKNNKDNYKLPHTETVNLKTDFGDLVEKIEGGKSNKKLTNLILKDNNINLIF